MLLFLSYFIKEFSSPNISERRKEKKTREKKKKRKEKNNTMFARKDIEHDILSDYRQYRRNLRNSKGNIYDQPRDILESKDNKHVESIKEISVAEVI